MHVLEDYPIIHSTPTDNFHLNFSLETASNILSQVKMRHRTTCLIRSFSANPFNNNTFLLLPLELLLMRTFLRPGFKHTEPQDFELTQLATTNNLRGTTQQTVKYGATERSKKGLKGVWTSPSSFKFRGIINCLSQ